MGIQSDLESSGTGGLRPVRVRSSLRAARTAVSTGLEAWMGRVLLGMRRVPTSMGTRVTRMPEHAVSSRLNANYEVSTRGFRSTDLRRIC